MRRLFLSLTALTGLFGCTEPGSVVLGPTLDSEPVAPASTPSGELSFDAPAWSPDGARIAFQSDQDGSVDIYVMDADGANAQRLTSDGPLNVNPVWSPDGTRIAFVSARDANYEVYVMNADGSEQQRLTNSDGRDDKPAWSPDGSRIAFSSDREGERDLYVMDADGTNLERLRDVLLTGG